MKRPAILFLQLAFVLIWMPSLGQISVGGTPYGIERPADLPIPQQLDLKAPDLARLSREDDENLQNGRPPRVAVWVPVGKDISESGTWTRLPDGTRVWRLALNCSQTLAISVSFDRFHLPGGSRLFLYDLSGHNVIGAFTDKNNKPHGHFATQLIPSESVILEYSEPPWCHGTASLSIDGISYAYRYMPGFVVGRGSSGECEVNAACPEGLVVDDQKRGVSRIYLKDGSNYYWCTGSLVNNTARNRVPYFLTADHCAPAVTPSDLDQWVFYFNYLSSNCQADLVPGTFQTVVGADLMAHSDTYGSDFVLLHLDEDVPDNYNPYFLGWNRENAPSPAGTCLHHPNGDILKVSTYTQPTISSSWATFPGTHWEVYWSETENGWGVTEGGSSGSPLFDDNGLLMGTLTGGLSDCEPGGGGTGTGPDRPDYFGKFSFSWDQNGSSPSERLKEWLDPLASGVLTLSGINASLTADFQSDHRIILPGQEINFTDLSSGGPHSWEWTFEGGSPAGFSGQEPPEITYPVAGTYKVSLVVSRESRSDTLVRNGYIRVIGKVYPTPASDIVNIFLDEDPPSYLRVQVFDLLGKKLMDYEDEHNVMPIIPINVSSLPAAIYLVRIQVGGEYLLRKIMVER